MRPFAICLTPNELGFFAGLLNHLPADLVDIHIGYLSGAEVKLEKLPFDICEKIEHQIDNGFSVIPINPDLVQKYKAVAMSTMIVPNLYKLFIQKGVQPSSYLVKLVHAVDGRPGMDPLTDAFLGSCERQATLQEPNKLAYGEDPEIWAKLQSFTPPPPHRISVSSMNMHIQDPTIWENGQRNAIFPKSNTKRSWKTISSTPCQPTNL